MKRIAIILFTALFFLLAYVSKPEDKKCIITVVKAVWGNLTPSEAVPDYFDQFMDNASQDVEVNDWLFLKQIRFRYKDKMRTVGFGAFNKVFLF